MSIASQGWCSVTYQVRSVAIPYYNEPERAKFAFRWVSVKLQGGNSYLVIANKLQIIPLGGLGEIGKNTTAIRYNNQILLIDAGLAFPDDDMLGVDLVIPDYTYLIENKDLILGILITHGHEDHIGALPYLLRDIDVPIFGTRLTLGIVQSKFKENNLNITIKDSGIGISKSDQEHLFSSFYRASNAINIQGTGLGLHIVKRYTDILQGTVSFNSEIEKGTTVYLILPELEN